MRKQPKSTASLSEALVPPKEKLGKRVVITYGTYDLFHRGHELLLQRAKALGDYLIVGVTSDAFDRSRGKLNVRQDLVERLQAVIASGIADKVIVEEYRGQKIADIQRYGVDVFTVGSDWEGKFEYLKNYCEVIYLPRTQDISSTQLRKDSSPSYTLGIIGQDYLCERMVRESAGVLGVGELKFYEPTSQGKGLATCGFQHGFEGSQPNASCQNKELMRFLSQVDAVYISCPINERAYYINQALEAGVHVLCEAPMFLSEAQAKESLEYAEQQGLILMEAIKTRYFPAFEHLALQLASGAVGEVKDIDASFSHVFEELDTTNPYQGSFYDLASYLLLPAQEFIGSHPVQAEMSRISDKGFAPWTRCNLRYKTAEVSLRAGRGMKTEGDLTITGTKGYIYVPAPWWKTEYFEVRGEDLRDTKKYFYPYAGEGQRYELSAFIKAIEEGLSSQIQQKRREAIYLSARLIERFDTGDLFELESGPYSFGGGEVLV